MKTYKADRNGNNILDDEGNIVLTIMRGTCSNKFKKMACKELANTLSNIERGKASNRNRLQQMEWE